MSIYLNADCMNTETGLPSYPDNYFDLAIVDPPYGESCTLSGGKAAKDGYADYWDKVSESGNWNVAPSEDYFRELFRVSKNQIIWGANHYPQHLHPSGGWIFWDKGQRDFSFSDGELAFSSFSMKLKSVTIHRASLHKEERMHPTQKPMALYRWLVKNYAKQGDKILDTHVGSASSLVVYEEMGFEYVGYELDPDYYRDSCKRLEAFRAQPKLFSGKEIFEACTTTLFDHA